MTKNLSVSALALRTVYDDLRSSNYISSPFQICSKCFEAACIHKCFKTDFNSQRHFCVKSFVSKYI